MPTSTSRLSFSDCFDFFEQAAADEFGIAIGFSDRGDAMQFRLRMNAARQIDRKDNADAYATEPDHPLFGRSIYDEFQLKIREANGKTYVVIERSTTKVLEVISLSEVAEQLKPLPAPEWKPPMEVLKLTDRRI